MSQSDRELHAYSPPALLASFGLAELKDEAATCTTYSLSDVALKTDVAPLEAPLERLGRLPRRARD